MTVISNGSTPAGPLSQPVILGSRIGAIDALRGLVMLFMLVDHIRETFFLHMRRHCPSAYRVG